MMALGGNERNGLGGPRGKGEVRSDWLEQSDLFFLIM